MELINRNIVLTTRDCISLNLIRMTTVKTLTQTFFLIKNDN